MKEKYIEAIKLICHDGLTAYKTRNSLAPITSQVKAVRNENNRGNVKGSVAVVSSKENLYSSGGVKGFPVTSVETLLDNVNKISHWTPNPYMYLKYVDDARTHIGGHEEKNLRQINTFVVDCDTKNGVEYTDLLLAGIDSGVGAPTMILETPQGFHAYYILDKPLYISNKNNFRGLQVAKTISSNLRHSFANQIKGIDTTCNDFGFFRLPNADNMRWFTPSETYTMSHLISWSRRESDNRGRSLFAVKTMSQSVAFNDLEWVHGFLKLHNIKGNKGISGRDKLIFTLALGCYESGIDQDTAENFLDQVNSSLYYPLQHRIVLIKIKSAYSGRYRGASLEKINEVLTDWGVEGVENKGINGFYKVAKPRVERTRSHWYEWENDIATFITQKASSGKPFVYMSQNEFCEEVTNATGFKLSRSTLNSVMDKSNKFIKKVIGAGKNAKTGYTTETVLLKYIIVQMKQHIENKDKKALVYRSYIELLSDTRLVTYREVEKNLMSGRVTLPEGIPDFFSTG
ncbi:replication initiation protein [Listeria booriae]|uniref:primase C-terminal domain-containing protein n=1 Tax=Listeria booriae TaxID=1552123 RepID=UPI0016269F26|nr:replication initiation protein [Listeria booriae]MBC1920477.1 replication initiation protein [Listeria booriae]